MIEILYPDGTRSILPGASEVEVPVNLGCPDSDSFECVTIYNNVGEITKQLCFYEFGRVDQNDSARATFSQMVRHGAKPRRQPKYLGPWITLTDRDILYYRVPGPISIVASWDELATMEIIGTDEFVELLWESRERIDFPRLQAETVLRSRTKPFHFDLEFDHKIVSVDDMKSRLDERRKMADVDYVISNNIKIVSNAGAPPWQYLYDFVYVDTRFHFVIEDDAMFFRLALG